MPPHLEPQPVLQALLAGAAPHHRHLLGLQRLGERTGEHDVREVVFSQFSVLFRKMWKSHDHFLMHSASNAAMCL